MVDVSVDIDVFDPAQAPGSGAPEVAGITTREFFAVLWQLAGLNIVGDDIVEVAPAYDPRGRDRTRGRPHCMGTAYADGNARRCGLVTRCVLVAPGKRLKLHGCAELRPKARSDHASRQAHHPIPSGRDDTCGASVRSGGSMTIRRRQPSRGPSEQHPKPSGRASLAWLLVQDFRGVR